MIIPDSDQILITGLLSLRALWGVLDAKIKGELGFTLQEALEITAMGGRGATVRLSGGWRKTHKLKETSRDPRNIKRVWVFKMQNSIYLSRCDSLQSDAGTLHFTYYVSLFIQTIISREFVNTVSILSP